MTNNANFDIAGKLFAYIAHKSDLSQEMTTKYNSSLIFIGDEQQIYVPIKNTYVGIGKTSYNQTIQTIEDLRTELNKLTVLSENQSVQKIYPQFGNYDNAFGPVDNRTSIIDANNLSYLTGSVEITSIGDYDASSGFAYTTYWHPLNGHNNNGAKFRNSTVHWHDQYTPATSGIRISYEAEYTNVTDPTTGITYKKAGKQRLVIDDTQTWSYMTSAYSYSLKFSREYTNNQIETLYHDILGEPQKMLVPVNDEDIYKINTATGEKEWVNKEVLYFTYLQDVPTYVVSGNAPESTYWISYSLHQQATHDHTNELDPNGTKWDLGTQRNQNSSEHPQFYVVSTTYDYTYNTNISNGIQTLKEVAYILDQLSDGSLGSVTYLTRTQWQALTFVNPNPTGNAYTISNNQNTYHRVYTNGIPTSNATSYGYWINKANPENLGIQIAYSIAGNKADIDDLHDHILLNEQGRTSVRSVAVESSNMMTVSVFANNSFESTDTEQTITNPSGDGRQTYNLGDSRFIIGLDLASIYFTKTTTADANGSINGVEFHGLHQKADITKIAGRQLDNTYLDNSFQNANGQYVNSLDKSLNDIYWYQGRSASYDYINDKFIAIDSQQDFDELRLEGTYIFAQNTTNNTTKGQFHRVMNPVWRGDSYTYYYCTNLDGEKPVVTHAIIDETKNQIATTAWTIALLNDHSGDISDDLTNVYQKAKNYTDKSIDELDAQLSYMDFNVTNALSITGHPAFDTNIPEGTDAYTAQYNNLRNWWNEYIHNTNNLYDMASTSEALTPLGKYAYLSNKVRSQYISNIVEEDGIIISAETTELPLDELAISTSIWGNQDAEFAKPYKKITFGNSPSEVKQLLSYTQVYFKHKTLKSYEKVPNGTEISITGSYYYVSNDGEYLAADPFDKAHFNIGKANSAYWKQLYKQVSAYYEIDLDTVKGDNSGNISEFDYNYYETVGNPTIPNKYVVANGDNVEYFTIGSISSTSYSTKYISGDVIHYDYTKNGGFGQNRINLTTHITHIEDATPMNTGLTDAWDVASFIANMCEWVDLAKVFPQN